MRQVRQTLVAAFKQAMQELRVNKLRTGLSLMGITIGIFCIIAVLTLIDSMKQNVEKELSSLGSDVMYVNRWPWMDESGEYKWWEFFTRPSMGMQELRVIQKDVPTNRLATLCFPMNTNVKYRDDEMNNINVYGVTAGFDQVQNIDVSHGRYLTNRDIESGSNTLIMGSILADKLFNGQAASAVQKRVRIEGKQFTIVGVLKKIGTSTAGFQFDESCLIPYHALHGLVDVRSLSYDPLLMLMPAKGVPIEEMKYEVEGALRRVRKVKPGEKNNFAMNELSTITDRVNDIFKILNMVGALIGGFSLVVGGFGIANIMFVSVKERTKFIGLKKAIGAKKWVILSEFLLEAIVLCIVGGLIGIAIVMLLAFIMSTFLDFPVTMSVSNFIIGIGISAAIGLVAGFIPAFAASKMNPVVAIRTT